MRMPLIVFAAVAVAGAATAQSLEPRIHDLRALLRDPDRRLTLDQAEPFVVPWVLPLLSPDYVDDEAYEVGSGTRVDTLLGRHADAQPLLDWLVDALHVGEDPGRVRVGELQGSGRVLIEASADAHEGFARRLAELEAAALRPVEVELIRLPAAALADLPMESVLDRSAVDELLAAHPPLGIWRQSTRTGVATVVRAGETRSYLRDIEVEVASQSTVTDPKMGLMHLGLLATVRVARGPRDGAFVTCALRRTDESAASRIAETEFVRLRLPAVEVELHEVRALLPVGGAVALGAATGPGSVWVLRVRGLGGVRPDAVPLGGIEGLPWRGWTPEWIGMRPLRDRWLDEEEAEEQVSELLPAELRDAIDQHDSSEDVPGLMLGDAWVTARESAALTRVRGLATAYAAGSRVALRYAVAVVDGGTAGRLLQGGAEVSEVAAAAAARGLLPTRTGDLAVAVVGTERAFLRDHDVEIAQEASIANPIVDSWFEGVGVRLEVRVAGPDGFDVRGDVGCQRAAAGEQQLERRAYDRGPIDAPRVDHARVEVDAHLAGGRWQLAGVAPFGRGELQMVVLLRVDG